MGENRKRIGTALDLTRRDFMKTAALTVGGAGAVALGGAAGADTGSESGLASPTLALAGYRYDRTLAVADGKVQVGNYGTDFTEMGIGDINTHVFSGPQTLDVVEIGLHPYMLAFANDDFRDYVLLPIFPLRLFRHKSVFIRNDRGISKPADLKGRKIAAAGYSSTSLTWIRGIFEEEYGLSPADMTWIISNKDSSAAAVGKASAQENVLPDGVTIVQGPAGKDESDLLEAGEVDAVFHAAEPKGFVQGHSKIARLFPDSRATEQDFFARTGIFPIMHAVAAKRSLVDGDPALVEAVFAAYSESKRQAYARMAGMAGLMDTLPWYGQELAATKELMGDNFYSYGIEPNRKSLETLFRYSHEQGLCSRRLTIEEIFEPSSLTLGESAS